MLGTRQSERKRKNISIFHVTESEILSLPSLNVVDVMHCEIDLHFLKLFVHDNWICDVESNVSYE